MICENTPCTREAHPALIWCRSCIDAEAEMIHIGAMAYLRMEERTKAELVAIAQEPSEAEQERARHRDFAARFGGCPWATSKIPCAVCGPAKEAL